MNRFPRSCLLLLCTAMTLPAQDWPQWRGPNRDGKAAGFTAPKTWPKELTEKWKVAVGEGVATPALVGDKLYVFSRQEGGEVTRCLEAATGNVLWHEPMGQHHASPVHASGLVYFLNDDGVAHVVKAAGKYELVARNEIGEKTYASPVFSDGRMFLRSFKHLYCIGTGK